LPQIPKIHQVSELFTIPNVADYNNIKIAIPAIIELTDWLIETTTYSEGYSEVLTVPKIFAYEKIVSFEVLILADLFVALTASQILGDLFIFLDIPRILDCCFKQNEQEEKLEKHQESIGERKNKQESKDKVLPQPPSYCEILYPILLPQLSLEAHDDSDFYNPLRSYQKQGIRFLFDSPSVLLADEMGTGKTVQAVNALRLLFRQALIESALIICPPAVIGRVDLSVETSNSEGWSGHFYHWAPELQVVVMHGVRKEQRKMDWQKPSHVYITTYDTLRIDLTEGVLINLQQFDCIILDEAQKIKNRSTKTAQAIRRLQANYRWALTGTPIENRLDDVKSLFDFIRPGTFLGGVEYSSQDVLSTIKPFMLRRLKQDVLQYLPDKERQEVWLDLDNAQKTAYNEALDAGRRKIETSLDREPSLQIKRHIFALLAELKQICNFAKGESTSPKMDLLLELLDTIAANQKKVLIFSQYRTEGIDKIAQQLTQAGISYMFYKGSQHQKDQAVSDFRHNSEITVFLATFQSAGYGITLTEATYVIHFDHLWNPAKMQNAEDRVHRIGQTKGVTIYSFWMKATIEERIKKKLIDKHILIDNTINILAAELDDDALISTEDWLDIFDIKLAKKTADVQVGTEKFNGKLDRKVQSRRLAVRASFQNNQNKLSPPSTSIHTLEQIKHLLETMKNFSQHIIFNIQGNYIENSIEGITLMSDQSPIFNQQGATIGVNYAASGSKQEFTQNVVPTEQNFEALLSDFEQFINDLRQKHPNATDETAIQIIEVEAKEIQQKQPLRWQNFLNLQRLWNGGKKAAFKVGEHYAEQSPLGKGAIAFLEGVMEEPK
jgi:superfamily II DNA/RNA helicase